MIIKIYENMKLQSQLFASKANLHQLKSSLAHCLDPYIARSTIGAAKIYSLSF